jgi:hypothetical protein
MTDCCGVCGARVESGKPLEAFAVRADATRWVAKFTYPLFVCPANSKERDANKAWEASEGVAIALACKAILGPPPPFLWYGEGSWQSAAMVAEIVGRDAMVEWVCPACVKKNEKVRGAGG